MLSSLKNCTRFLEGFWQQCVGKYAAVVQVRHARVKAFPDLPEKPKRPPSPWLLFLTERRNELKQRVEYQDLSLMEMSKRISEEWRNFDELDKIPYKEKYEESLDEYRRQKEEYTGSLTPENKRVLRSIKSEGKQGLRKFEKEIPKPKYPGNGYILFVKSCLRENPRSEDEDMKDWIRECAQRWQNLDEETKLRLNEQASPLMKKYREELREWKDKYEV
jgi:exonuclease VII large subunit